MAFLQVLVLGCLLGLAVSQPPIINSTQPPEVDDFLSPDLLHVDHCQSFPCLNGGSCFQKGGKYKCSCPYGYFGTNCERAKDKDILALENRVSALENMVYTVIKSVIRRMEWNVDSFKKDVNRKLHNFFDSLRQLDTEGDESLDFDWDMLWGGSDENENTTRSDDDDDDVFNTDDIVRTWSSMQNHFRSRLRNLGEHVRRNFMSDPHGLDHRRNAALRRGRGPRRHHGSRGRQYWWSRRDRDSSMDDSSDEDEIDVEDNQWNQSEEHNDDGAYEESERYGGAGPGWKRTASTRRTWRQNHRGHNQEDTSDEDEATITNRNGPRDGKAKFWGKRLTRGDGGNRGSKPLLIRQDGHKPSKPLVMRPDGL